jgi:hypothetical protein
LIWKGERISKVKRKKEARNRLGEVREVMALNSRLFLDVAMQVGGGGGSGVGLFGGSWWGSVAAAAAPS